MINLKRLFKGKSWPDDLTHIQNGMKDIEHHMLHFLDNHDEQRLASPEFAGSAIKGKPMMVISATISTSPTMLWTRSRKRVTKMLVLEPTRTSIFFDYSFSPTMDEWR
jgi:hypothetical protein